MAYFKFTNKLANGEPIQIYDNGKMERDFTYIDDIICGIIYVMQSLPNKNENGLRYKIYNIGSGKSESLLHFVDILEECLLNECIISEKGKREFLPRHIADVYHTCADISEIKKDFNFTPSFSLEKGLSSFVKWYKEYYK